MVVVWLWWEGEMEGGKEGSDGSGVMAETEGQKVWRGGCD